MRAVHALMLLAVVRLLPAPSSFALYAAMVVMFPKLAVVGGMINNDNLAVLATGIAIFGLARWQLTTDQSAAAPVALGLALAGWTKLTVLQMIGIAFGAAEALGLWRERAWPNMGDAAIIVAGGAIAAIPTLQNLLTYGRPLFISSTHNFVEPAQRPTIGIALYAVDFLRSMWLKRAALEPMQLVQSPSLVALLGIWLAGVPGNRRYYLRTTAILVRRLAWIGASRRNRRHGATSRPVARLFYGPASGDHPIHHCSVRHAFSLLHQGVIGRRDRMVVCIIAVCRSNPRGGSADFFAGFLELALAPRNLATGGSFS